MKNLKINFSKQIISRTPTQKEIYQAVNILLAKKIPQQILSTTIIEFGVNYISSQEIQKLNSKYRHLDKPTDVLSFPIYSNVSDIQQSPNHVNNLGDIFICLPEAKKNAQDKKTTLNDEIIFLILHGLKHLLGFHHR